MTPDDRMTPSLFLDILDVLERHGYHRYDDQHTGRAMFVIGDLARVYEGDPDAPHSIYVSQALPAPPPEPRPPARGKGPAAVIFTGTEVSTVLSALYTAAEDNCDRTEMCADCADQSCPACQSRLQAARAYDHLSAQIIRMTQAQPAHREHPEPGSRSLPPGQPDPAAGREAGQ